MNSKYKPWIHSNIPLEKFESLDAIKFFEEYDQDEETVSHNYFRMEAIRNIIMNDFTKQQREIFLMYFQYKLRQQYIAKVLRVSQAHVCQCVKKCIKKLKSKLNVGGVPCRKKRRKNKKKV